VPAADPADARAIVSSMLSRRRSFAAVALVALSGCGGGSNGSGTGSSSWTAGTFPPSSTFANRCQTPRTGIDPTTGRPYADVQGSTLNENNFLRSWTNELYLWYREVPDRDPAGYSTTSAYFDVLKTTATTASGNPKDKFHFTYATADWVALSQSGVEAGYGVQWTIISSRPPRQVVVAYTDPGTPATAANLARGAQVMVGVYLPFNRIFIIGLSIICVLGIYLMLFRSSLGLRVRAVMQNRNMSSCLGIPTRKVDAYTFAFGSGLAGIAGWALTLVGNVDPGLGQNYIVDAFMVVVTGGVGKLAGTIVASLGIGGLNKLIEPSFGAVYGKVFILVLVILFLQWRPSGLFAMKGRSAD